MCSYKIATRDWARIVTVIKTFLFLHSIGAFFACKISLKYRIIETLFAFHIHFYGTFVLLFFLILRVLYSFRKQTKENIPVASLSSRLTWKLYQICISVWLRFERQHVCTKELKRVSENKKEQKIAPKWKTIFIDSKSVSTNTHFARTRHTETDTLASQFSSGTRIACTHVRHADKL